MVQVVEKSGVGSEGGSVPRRHGRPATASSKLFEIEVPARSEYLEKPRQAIAKVAEQFHLTTEDTCDLLLAVGEACNNAVQHGSGSDIAALQVRCHLKVRSEAHKLSALQVEIANTGNGFLPAKNDIIFSMPEAEDLSGHGRGLPLMRALMDNVQIFCKNGNTVVRLTKKIS